MAGVGGIVVTPGAGDGLREIDLDVYSGIKGTIGAVTGNDEAHGGQDGGTEEE